MSYYNTPLDPRNPQCNHCEGKDFWETSTEWVCRSCATCHNMPVFVQPCDQATYSAPLNLNEGRQLTATTIRTIEQLCSKLSIEDDTQSQIIKLLQEASGRLHIKERVIGAAIYFITNISSARIGVLVGKEELNKGWADLRSEMVQHPTWEPLVKQLRKETASTSIYTNLNAIMSLLKLSPDNNMNLRKHINKLDELVGNKYPKGLVRDVTVLWMAVKLTPINISLKKVAKVAELSVQGILRTERILRDALGL